MKYKLLQTLRQSVKDYKNLTHMSFIPVIPLLLIDPIEAQLTLEQYGFELRGSLMGFFFFSSVVNTVVVNDLWLVESADTQEPQIERSCFPGGACGKETAS